LKSVVSYIPFQTKRGGRSDGRMGENRGRTKKGERGTKWKTKRKNSPGEVHDSEGLKGFETGAKKSARG